jgi:riboflavin-specific deaminase-like protein
VSQEIAPRKTTADRILALVQSVLHESAGAQPRVTVSWAQTATGAIAAVGGVRATISGPESMTLTHSLRAVHDAILVGIQTMLADDPQLSVRLVEGPQPQPIVLDSHLRFPLAARLLARTDRKPWIFHDAHDPTRERELETRGARLFKIRGSAQGLDLVELLRMLAAQGVRALMVEGGARVLSAFIKQGLAHQAVVTVSPSMMEGVPGPGIPEMLSAARETLGADTVLWGRLPATRSSGLSGL